MNKDIFNTILNSFENDDLKKFTEECIDTIPSYWYSVPASSTGKYHPQYSLGDGGLARHTLAVVRLLNHMLSVDCIRDQYTSRERDLLRIAALMHDSRKSGTQEEFEKSKWTRFNHPLLASDEVAKVWNNHKDKTMTIEEVKIIRHTIESHMGQWNTDKRSPDVTLPTPQDKYQIILHLADYLASRKDIELLFDKHEETKHKQEAEPDIYTWRLPFGKYSGMTLLEVKNMNPGYIEWAKNNIDSEPCHSLVVQL